MGKGVIFVIGVVAVVGGLIFVFKGLDDQVKRLKFENERHAIKERFAERIPALAAADEEHAGFDLTQAIRNYGKELAELYKKYPEFRDVDSILKRHEAEYKEGKKEESKMRGVRERISMTKDVWQRLLDDKYKPIVTVHGPSLRLDFFDIEKKNQDGQDQLFIHSLFVGGVADKSMTYGPIQMVLPLADDEATAKKRKAGQLKDNKEQRRAELNGGGEPAILIPEPEKFVEDFPPGVMIGLYQFPLFPAEAKALELTMNFEFKNPGGGRVVNDMKFKPIEVKPEWKLPAGASFDADEQGGGGGGDD